MSSYEDKKLECGCVVNITHYEDGSDLIMTIHCKFHAENYTQTRRLPFDSRKPTLYENHNSCESDSI